MEKGSLGIIWLIPKTLEDLIVNYLFSYTVYCMMLINLSKYLSKYRIYIIHNVVAVMIQLCSYDSTELMWFNWDHKIQLYSYDSTVHIWLTFLLVWLYDLLYVTGVQC